MKSGVAMCIAAFVAAHESGSPVILVVTKVDIAKMTVNKYANEAYPSWASSHSDACPKQLTDLNEYMNNKDVKDPWGSDYKMYCGSSLPAVSAPITLAAGTATRPGEDRRRRGLLVAGALHLLDLVHVTDRVHELVGGERLHQELACPGEHRASQVVLLALDAHHDDRRFGHGVRDDLGRRDAVHVGHVDVHEDHVGAVPLGEFDRLLPTVGRGHDRHVGLEADELREVFPRFRDVIDDEDADLLSHGRDS